MQYIVIRPPPWILLLMQLCTAACIVMCIDSRLSSMIP
jgi:hypothetical protein